MIKYYKIFNSNENHNGFQYEKGLNKLKDPFNENPNESCCPGGFYFTDLKNLHKFVLYGDHIREIILPKDNPGFKMVPDPEGDKWRANMIILGEIKYSFTDPHTYHTFLSERISLLDHKIFLLSVKYGCFDIVQTFVQKGIDINKTVFGENALGISAENGQLHIIKYLVNLGANIRAYNDHALRISASNGHLEVVKYLVEQGANIYYALRLSQQNGHLDVVKYLKSLT